MMRTSELTGALLDYWVARAEGVPAAEIDMQSGHPERVISGVLRPSVIVLPLRYSTDWAHSGPLIEKYQLAVRPANHWAADNFTGYGDGDTPLQAICRAVVRAAFGDEVPDLAEGGA